MKGTPMHRVLVREIMRTNVITIHPEELVADAAQLLEENRIRRLPVVDDDGCLAGIITDGDVREAESAHSVLNTYDPGADEEWLAVADVMTRDVVTIGPDATVGELAMTLMERKVGGAPVVVSEPRYPKRKLLVGIVTETDIFRLIAEAWQRERESQTDSAPPLTSG
jgi:acetoin utilization protein AcuB